MYVQCIKGTVHCKRPKDITKELYNSHYLIYLYKLYIYFYVFYNVIKWRCEVQSSCLYICSSIIGLMRPLYEVKNQLFTYLLHKAESFLRIRSVISQSRNSAHFMEPEGSLPHPQQPATCTYPQPAGSSPCSHIPLPVDPFQYYLLVYVETSCQTIIHRKPCAVCDRKYRYRL